MRQNKKENEEELVERPNKSQMKRDLAEMFALCERFLVYSRSTLEEITDFDPRVIDAIIEASKLPPSGSRKRHIKFISKQLKGYEPSQLQEIHKQLSGAKQKIKAAPSTKNIWLSKLLEPGDSALNNFIDTYSDVDRQHLRTLVRNARKNANTPKQKHFEDKLLAYLSEMDQD